MDRTERRRYRSDDRDIQGRDNDLVLFQGENGDWYVSIVQHGRKLGPTVRVTTSGAPPELAGVAAALVNLHRAMGGEPPAEPEVEEPPYVCPGCQAFAGEEHASFCPDKAIEEHHEREAELRQLYPEDFPCPFCHGPHDEEDCPRGTP